LLRFEQQQMKQAESTRADDQNRFVLVWISHLGGVNNATTCSGISK
jgi:hypothetical protein